MVADNQSTTFFGHSKCIFPSTKKSQNFAFTRTKISWCRRSSVRSFWSDSFHLPFKKYILFIKRLGILHSICFTFLHFMKLSGNEMWVGNMGCKFLAFSFLARNEKFYAISREKREKARNFFYISSYLLSQELKGLQKI